MNKNHWVVAVLAAVVLIVGAYSVHEHSAAASAKQQADSAKQQNAAMLSSLQSTTAEVEQLRAKIEQMTAPNPAAAPPAERATAKASPLPHRPRMARHVRREDPRWKKVQSQLDEQGKAIASTREDLTAARTELGDSIARTHGELVVLQRKGERNYYEFDIDKQKRFSTVGPMGIRLRKANVKHQYSDLELLVDDRSLTKKHVNIYEPAMFYSAEGDQPIQVIVNAISKNHIHGYVSAPKYRPSELAAQENTAQPAAAQETAPQPKPRRKLVSR